MLATRLPPAYNSLLDFLVEKASPQEILAFQASAEEQKRADELTQKNKAGQLSPEEVEELQQMLDVDLIVMGLKARALVAMKQK
jgi:hypothetical protein